MRPCSIQKVSAVLVILTATQTGLMYFSGIRPNNPAPPSRITLGETAHAETPPPDPGDRVTFSGHYAPRDKDLSSTIRALSGWQDPDVSAPNYMPEDLVEQSFFQVLEGNASVHPVAAKGLAERKLKAMNLHLLTLGKPLYAPQKAEHEAKEFIVAVDEAVPVLDEVFGKQYGFTREELTVMHRFIAKTAPILFEMGFPDPVRHAAQVSRLCVIQAHKQGADKAELLQAAMVGWLHDPKLASELSRENLATHPVIGSAIARHIFDDPTFRSELEKLPSVQKMGSEKFANGVVEALSINNDSRYVLTEVILKAIQPFVSNPDKTEKIALKRFMASLRGAVPPSLSDALTRELEQGEVPSGLRGLSLSRLEVMRRELAPSYPPLQNLSASQMLALVLQNQPISGLEEPRRQALIEEMQARLQADPQAVVRHHINALSLFSHHQEVKSGRVAALALASSDPLLLSPHKIIEAEKEDTCLAGISAFLTSFNNNVTSVPRRTRDEARLWQRDLYLHMIQAAEELTGKKLKPAFTGKNVTAKVQVDRLAKVLNDPASWRAQDGTDYGAASLNDPASKALAERLIATMKAHYDQAAETSPALFGAGASSPRE